MAMNTTPLGTTTALVVSKIGGPFEVKQITLKELKPGEILVRMIATGVCHTDFAGTNGRIPVPTPVIAGHEGGGIVEKISEDVHHLSVGDHVLLTYPACLKCIPCLKGNPAYCQYNGRLSFGGSRLDGTVPFSLDGQDVHNFFQQSSFAHRSIVNSACAVRVDKNLPLGILCPLGCGIQTGAGTVLNVLKPGVGSSIVIFGVGSVGVAGIMAASKLTPASKIIAVDILDSKLKLAIEMGATHIINSKEKDLVRTLLEMTDGNGTDCAYDTTGSVKVIEDMLSASAKNAVAATVGGAPLGSKISIEIATWIGKGIHYTGSCQGSSVPQLVYFLPALVDLWKQGRFPVERLIRHYHYSEINSVREDMHSGDCMKGVLLWDDLQKETPSHLTA